MRNALLLLTLSIGCALIVPALFMDGMFMDGVLYSSVSKNYALGLGTFWEPHFSATAGGAFHEQPPLLFFLQGVFFKVLGLAFYTERIYSLCTAIVGVVLLLKIWQLIYPTRSIGYLPLFVYFTIPVTFWSYINGVAECTMVLFVLAAAYVQLKALQGSSLNAALLLLSGAFLTLAGLTKGIQGLFLLAGPALFWFSSRSISLKRATWSTFFVACIPLLSVLFFYFYEPAHASFEAYFKSRFTKTFSGATATGGSHFAHLKELWLYSIPALLITGIAILVCGYQNVATHFRQHRKIALFMLFVGLSGILPLMVTLEQRGFYQLTALPFIALFFSILIAPLAEKLQEKTSRSRVLQLGMTSLAIVVLTGSLIFTVWKWGQPKRDADKLHDLAIVSATMGEDRLLALDNQSVYDWPLICYMERIHGIAVNYEQHESGRYLLSQYDIQDPNWTQMALPLQTYRLYIKR
jgi:hypothetical protein